MNRNKVVGDIGEAVCLTEFVKRNIKVYIPFSENSSVDLVADFNGKLNKIQVKTSEKLENGRISWNVSSSIVKNGKFTRHSYTEEEIDYYCFYNIETSLCLLIPVSSIKNKTEIVFTYPFVFCKTARSNHNWEDYTFDKTLGRLPKSVKGSDC